MVFVEIAPEDVAYCALACEQILANARILFRNKSVEVVLAYDETGVYNDDGIYDNSDSTYAAIVMNVNESFTGGLKVLQRGPNSLRGAKGAMEGLLDVTCKAVHKHISIFGT